MPEIQPSGMTKHPYFSPQPLLIVFVKPDNAAEGFDSVYKCMLLLLGIPTCHLRFIVQSLWEECFAIPVANGFALLRGHFGRKQVNKALHTCTSWYAYAAMFGSSIDTMVPRALKRMYRLH